LQFHNLLADPKSKRLSGIIDWTDACIAPIAREFAIGELMQNDRLRKATELYEKKTGIRIDREQALMWRAIEELTDYVEELENNELSEAAETLDRIKYLIDLKP
jgi:aminoglycoside phosphotransferase (APT) family kinase protein